MRAALFVLLAACAHGGEVREQHPCDPEGAAVARFPELSALDSALSPDELALRGTCASDRADRALAFSVDQRARALVTEANAGIECSGKCEPALAGLPPFDERHDLEDDTLQRECASAVTKLDEGVRAGCRNVCLALRRKLASKAIFARVMLGLRALESNLPVKDADDASVRRMWLAAQQPLPPKRFRFAAHQKEQTITADGTLYPGGPSARLRLVLGGAGCGESEWTVDTW